MIMKGIQYVEVNQQPTKQFSLPGVRGSYPIGLNYRPII
jgi:hypothetical protein